MSTQSPIYIMWGVILPYPENRDEEQFEAAIEQYTDSAFKQESVNAKNDITVLLDGMGGKYMAVGHVLARSGPYGDDLGTHSIPQVDLHDPEVLLQFTGYQRAIIECLAELGQTADPQTPIQWHVIQHYR